MVPHPGGGPIPTHVRTSLRPPVALSSMSAYPACMNRLSLILRSLAVVAALIFVAASVGVPVRGAAPAAPLASCSGPPIGSPVGPFWDCAECQYYGQEGASMGQWYSWRCRLEADGYYYLWVT